MNIDREMPAGKVASAMLDYATDLVDEGWSQGAYARHADGSVVDGHTDLPGVAIASYCPTGAMQRFAAKMEEYGLPEVVVNRALCFANERLARSIARTIEDGSDPHRKEKARAVREAVDEAMDTNEVEAIVQAWNDDPNRMREEVVTALRSA